MNRKKRMASFASSTIKFKPMASDESVEMDSSSFFEEEQQKQLLTLDENKEYVTPTTVIVHNATFDSHGLEKKGNKQKLEIIPSIKMQHSYLSKRSNSRGRQRDLSFVSQE